MLIKLLINNCEKMVKVHLPWNENDIPLHSTKNQNFYIYDIHNQRSSSAWRWRTKSSGLRFEIHKTTFLRQFAEPRLSSATSRPCCRSFYESLMLSKVRRWHNSSLKATLSPDNSDFLSHEATYRFISWGPCGLKFGSKSEKPDITSHEATSNIIGWG